ncbi:MAG: DNA gyrase C-terminal beta-propeller domain-containing protein, partial [Candidatus Izemoplasmatales bacterium]|nr:DNA gyrase C-terminal beta-propeller domain-containing protein [Candidatus Izemoplasmatales bacterium]
AEEDLREEILIAEALEMKEKYGDARRSEIDPYGDFDIEDEDLIPVEDVIIAVTTNGYVKRMNLDVYRSQNRGGRGKTGMKMNDDDVIDSIISMSTHDYLLFFTSLGRVYKIKGYKVPNYGRNSKGLPIVNLLNLVEGETLAAVMPIKNFEEGFLFFTTTKGVVKRTPVSDFQNIRTNGIRALSLRDGDTLHSVKLTDGEREILIGASNGKAIRFFEKDARDMGRNAAGVRGIWLEDKEEVVGVAVVEETKTEILAITEHGYGKRTDVEEYRLQTRGGKGVKTINVTEKNGNLKKLISVEGTEDLLVVTDKGMMIRVPIDQIAQTKRSTQGVRIINLMEGHTVATIAIVAKAEDDEYLDTAESDEMVAEAKPEVEKPVVAKEDVAAYKEFSELSLEDELSEDEEDATIEEILGDSY